MLCSCQLYTVLVLLKLVNILETRPQLIKPPLSTDDIPYPDVEIITSKRIAKRSPTSESAASSLNKTKKRILNTSRRRGGISFSDYSEQDIIFPDSYEIVFEPLPRIDGPPKCANGNTFCENFTYYPYHHLKEVLQRHALYKDLFGKDEAPVEISNRVGGEGDIFVCGSIDRTIFPKVGKTKNSKWKYIINQGEADGFVQGVRIETCRNADSPCDIIGELPNGYTTACKQKYVYRRMLSLNDSGSPTPDTFQLPSACCCSYRRNLEFLARFGAPAVTPAKVKG